MEALGHGSSPGNCWQAAHRSSLTAKSPAPLPDKKVEERFNSHLTKSNPIRMEELLQAIPPPQAARLVWPAELELRFPWLTLADKDQPSGALEASVMQKIVFVCVSLSASILNQPCLQ